MNIDVIALLADAPAKQNGGMGTDALIFMISVWFVVICAMGYCFFKILTSKKVFGLDDEAPDHVNEKDPEC